jgi:hypothetical protein
VTNASSLSSSYSDKAHTIPKYALSLMSVERLTVLTTLGNLTNTSFSLAYQQHRSLLITPRLSRLPIQVSV